jgi:hypothetical protein
MEYNWQTETFYLPSGEGRGQKAEGRRLGYWLAPNIFIFVSHKPNFSGFKTPIIKDNISWRVVELHTLFFKLCILPFKQAFCPLLSALVYTNIISEDCYVKSWNCWIAQCR